MLTTDIEKRREEEREMVMCTNSYVWSFLCAHLSPPLCNLQFSFGCAIAFISLCGSSALAA